MMETLLIEQPGIALGAWVTLYVSDYYLTLWGATLYQRTARAYIELGSYEMEPVFQGEIDRLRAISPVFIRFLLLSSALLLLAWWMSVRWAREPAFYLIGCGAYLFVELVVHIRHVRNILWFRALGVPGAVERHLRYARWVTERIHVGDLVTFAVLFAVCYAISGQIMFVGGALGCLGIVRRHARSARRTAQ